MIEGGVNLIKLWMEVSDEEQKRRFEARIENPSASGRSARWIVRRGRNGTTTSDL